jgi:hypothetical protein
MTDSTEPRDDQAEAEATDSDEIDAADFPPEHSMGVGDLLANDVTAADESAPELDEDGDPAEEDWDVEARLPEDTRPAEESALHIVGDDELP